MVLGDTSGQVKVTVWDNLCRSDTLQLHKTIHISNVRPSVKYPARLSTFKTSEIKEADPELYQIPDLEDDASEDSDDESLWKTGQIIGVTHVRKVLACAKYNCDGHIRDSNKQCVLCHTPKTAYAKPSCTIGLTIGKEDQSQIVNLYSKVATVVMRHFHLNVPNNTSIQLLEKLTDKLQDPTTIRYQQKETSLTDIQFL
ncbi:uncharacterized protein [Ptychodera flava]|uniref:uncharacterized protein n=1 Tax=Ptychodera flava TaxID=63121 RepID=UPI003969E863